MHTYTIYIHTQDSQVNQHAAKNAEWDRDPCPGHARSLHSLPLHFPPQKRQRSPQLEDIAKKA